MGSPLRILHVISSISLAHGGPSGAVRTMMTALHRRGIKVDVATTDDDGPNKRLDVPQDRFIDLEGQRIRYFPRQTRRYCISHALMRWLRQGVRDYDIVQTHGLFTFAPIAAAWSARAARVPYVMAPHGVLDTWGMRNKSAFVKATSVRLLEGPLLAGAAAVHFMSELEQTRAASLALPIRPVVLPLGFDFNSADDTGAQPVDDLQAGGKRVILYLARIHPVKMVDVLLRAFADLPDKDSTVLAIAGDGDPALVASLKRLSSQLGVEANVRWLGFVSGARKRQLFSHATIFVLPSASENFGVAVVEAMNAGLPVIVTRGCGLSDFVSRSGAGLVTDGSVEGLRAALSRLLTEDERLRHEMGEAGRRAVDRELSLDVFGLRLEQLYQSILTGEQLPDAAATLDLRS